MRVVIVGAGYAGLSCALRLARKTRGQVQITLINQRPAFVERIRLHEQAAGTRAPTLLLAEFLRGTNVALELGRVDQIDLSAQTLRVGERALGWDRLVLALGSEDDLDRVPGVRDHAYALNADQLPALAARLKDLSQHAGRVVVVGAGLTGIEAACELAETYPSLQVSLLTRGALAPEVSPEGQRHVRHVLGELGVRCHEHTQVQRVEPTRLCTVDGELACEVCIWTAGFVAPRLARESGLSVNDAGQVWVDDRLRVPAHQHVYVIGDLAKLRSERGRELPMGCKLALPMGGYLADSLARELVDGLEAEPFRYRPPLYCVSLGRREALIQTLPLGSPRARVYGGWLAVRVKEWICRGTVLVLRWEQKRAAWSGRFGRRRAPALLAERATDRLHV